MEELTLNLHDSLCEFESELRYFHAEMENFQQLNESKPYRAHLKQMQKQLELLSGFMIARESNPDYDPASYRALDEVNKSFSAINKTEKLILDEIKAVKKEVERIQSEYDPLAKYDK